MENILNKYKSFSEKKRYCCKDLWSFITLFDEPEPGKLILYKPIWRDYILPFNKSEKIGVGIEYCPFCGRKFPKYLGDDWDKYLKKEYGLVWNERTEYFDDFLKRIPEEFQTDEWWIKRGL